MDLKMYSSHKKITVKHLIEGSNFCLSNYLIFKGLKSAL